MNTDQLLEALKELPLMNRWVIFPKVKEYYEVEKKQMEAILSLLSQQAVVVESDEEAFREALKWAGGFSIKHSLYRFLFDAGCSHVRQQLSKEHDMRWVKASERLPFSENKYEYFNSTPIPKLTYCCLKANGLYFSAFFNHATEEFELKQNDKLSWSRKVFDEYKIYWLDESADLSKEKQQREETNNK